ncbi:uncharacterized protein METZ01_LOCUS137728 [marine metagenome]|uniref:Uncharacterized protein n=1 Tax=marine metagenome TaxID=408172 RepID=A0A381Z6U3_9ZZZZ
MLIGTGVGGNPRNSPDGWTNRTFRP